MTTMNTVMMSILLKLHYDYSNFVYHKKYVDSEYYSEDDMKE